LGVIKNRKMLKTIITIITVISISINYGFSQIKFQNYFENEEEYPLMGNWKGKWINPARGHEVKHPELAAQIICIDKGKYKIKFISRLHVRAEPYFQEVIDEDENQLALNKSGWSFIFSEEGCKGYGNLHGEKTEFVLNKVNKTSPTMGIDPPEGAFILFDGKHLDNWQHIDNKPVTWKIADNGAMQIISGFWRNGKNRKEGLGGTIESKKKFGDLRFHMEFRYAVEPGKTGQSRGNSGLFFNGVGEIQILNSYGMEGYWNECGSLYKKMPPKVNAAAQPLQWQTYDVELIMPKYDSVSKKKISDAIITVWLNGIVIHNKTEIESNAKNVSVGLQDHQNIIEFRNIWVEEL
jgi:hypothetical protein